MSRRNPLVSLMETPLPTITDQKRFVYRPEIEEVIYVYNLLNKHIFDCQLVRPPIELGTIKKAWGMCIGDRTGDNYEKLYSTIRLYDKWYCPQWMVSVVAHEMCHQVQWDIDGQQRLELGKEPLLGHGPSFFKYRERLNSFGIPLKTKFSIRKWFKYQHITKC